MPQLEFLFFSDHFFLTMALLFVFFIVFIGFYVYASLKSFCFNVFFDSFVKDYRAH